MIVVAVVVGVVIGGVVLVVVVAVVTVGVVKSYNYYIFILMIFLTSMALYETVAPSPKKRKKGLVTAGCVEQESLPHKQADVPLVWRACIQHFTDV